MRARSLHILDPYAVPGRECKAQLHCHTTASDGKLQPQEVVDRYREAGYAFLALTDHDRITWVEAPEDQDFCVIPGVERTVPWPVRPLGPHLGCLFVHRLPEGRSARALLEDVSAQGGIACLNHPSWRGNLWTAQWTDAVLRRLWGYRLVEVWNPHSDPEEDVRRWVAACRRYGPGCPVAPVASDDLHEEGDFNRGWIVVRVEAITREALRGALLRGAVYASTGPAARFGAREGGIFAQTDASWIRFYDAQHRLRYEAPGPEAQYEPGTDDGFVRVECVGRSGARAWSAAFWVVPEEAMLP
ncbi:MAG: hypothetical protein QN172_03800 [Armatimonadota bacterium]|nr:hypothetical protein [Armatimonadota bacterium]MDR7438294.1 hypothetical protein [Armatimonadota bacterium]MDR7443384.1 hypothetical protein [Armatimonadota bacterium]MDR7563411.1 hypothetical protein [Armatimonadota bacterium]MDR7601565.1 hypothetical protein [Armatimonadota bacterium]